MTDNYDKVSLLLPMNGANNGTVFTDWSPVPKTVTATGAVTSTAQFKYYDSSGLFDGTNDYLSVPYNSVFNFTSGDFCIEAWVRFSSLATNNIVCCMYNGVDGTADNAWFFGWLTSNNLSFNFRTSPDGYVGTPNFSWTPSTGVWYHVAVSREGTSYRGFVDGALLGTVTEAAAIAAKTQNLEIGVLLRQLAGTAWFAGNIADLRITSGTARYTAAFTPPTRLIGTISNAAVGAGKILDAAGNPAERTVIAVPRSAPVRTFSDVSNASGEFEIQAPVGLEYSVVALADETSLYNDIVHRVISE